MVRVEAAVVLVGVVVAVEAIEYTAETAGTPIIYNF